MITMSSNVSTFRSKDDERRNESFTAAPPPVHGNNTTQHQTAVIMMHDENLNKVAVATKKAIVHKHPLKHFHQGVWIALTFLVVVVMVTIQIHFRTTEQGIISSFVPLNDTIHTFTSRHRSNDKIGQLQTQQWNVPITTRTTAATATTKRRLSTSSMSHSKRRRRTNNAAAAKCENCK